MTTPLRSHARAVTHLSALSSLQQCPDLPSLPSRDLKLRKSIFDPPQGLIQGYSARRLLRAASHLPQVEVVTETPRWLLLQVPQLKTNFFQRANMGRLGCPEELMLHVFSTIVSLADSFGYFRLTEKMLFIQRSQVRVWIHEDVFRNTPLMPIVSGAEGEKHFVIAFLALAQTCLDHWEKVAPLATIRQTIRLLEHRCWVAKSSRKAVFASQSIGCSLQYLKESFASQFRVDNFASCSQKLREVKSVEQFVGESLILTPSKNTFARQSAEGSFIPSHRGSKNEAEAAGNKGKFALSSTSSTIGLFSQKWRTTIGKKKLLEPSCSQEFISPTLLGTVPPVAPFPSLPKETLEDDFDGLFADEEEEAGYDEAELERIAEEIEEVLIW